MFQMAPLELREFSHLLQTACDQATAAIPDTTAITIDNTQLTFVSDVWTSAMTRDVLKVTIHKSWVRAKISAIAPVETTATSAALVLED